MLSAGMGACGWINREVDRSRLFNVFKDGFLNESKPDRAESLTPVVSGDLVKTGYRNGDGWAMQNYMGRHWSMTTFSKWFEEGDEGYTVQVRSKFRYGVSTYHEYDVVLYDRDGEALLRADDNLCSYGFSADDPESRYAGILHGLLYSITGESWGLKA